MRIISLNVNGIKTAKERGLYAWLAEQNADVVCLQDIRCTQPQIESAAFELPGYVCYASEAEVPEQGGVAIYSKLQPKAIITTLGFDSCDRFGRYLHADFDKLSIASVLMPSGRGSDESLNQKFKFMDDFTSYLEKQLRKRREYIYAGSLYVAHRKQDVKNWRDCQHLPGFLAPERAWLDEVIGNMGYVDALRKVSHELEQFSWWPDTEQAELLNLGWRFDYQLLTPNLRRFVQRASLPRAPRFSEHAPLIIDYDWLLSV